jgi:preprotein translocase subunit YajC
MRLCVLYDNNNHGVFLMSQFKNMFRSSALLMFSASISAFAQQAATGPQQVSGAAAGQPPGAPAWLNFALIAGIILFMWLFVFRPQSKRAKEQKDLSSLTPGMEVITAGGIVGTVTEVRESLVSLNLGSSNVRVLKSSISGKLDAAPSHVQK